MNDDRQHAATQRMEMLHTINADALEQLELLSMHLAEFENEIKMLESQRTAIRARIEPLVIAVGGKATTTYGQMHMTPAVEVRSYDTQKVDALLIELIASGQQELVNQISACVKFSTRKGGLRITSFRD